MARNKLVGQPRPKEVREKIGRTQAARLKQLRESGPLPQRKRCPKCGQWKDSPREFGWVKRKLRDGSVSWHARSWCKACIRAKSRAYRERLRAEGKLEAKQQEWNETRKKKKAAAANGREKEKQRMRKNAAYRRRKRAQTHDDPPPK